MLYKNITQASTPSGWSQSVTNRKQNTRQSKVNSITMYVVYIGSVRISLIYSFERVIVTKKTLGKNIIKSVVMKDRNCRVD